MWPCRRLFADQPVAQEIDQPGESGKPTHDAADGHQPCGEVGPHNVRGPPINQIGQKRADEADDWERYEHRMDRMFGNPGRRTRVFTSHRESLSQWSSVVLFSMA